MRVWRRGPPPRPRNLRVVADQVGIKCRHSGSGLYYQTIRERSREGGEDWYYLLRLLLFVLPSHLIEHFVDRFPAEYRVRHVPVDFQLKMGSHNRSRLTAA